MFELNPIQLEAQKLAKSDAKIILFRGGTGSGKTFAVCYFILMRALNAANSRHAIFRSTSIDVYTKIFDQTFKDVFNLLMPEDSAAHAAGMSTWDYWRKDERITKSPMVVRLPNGSSIHFGGLDDNEHLDRVLGADYATVFISECQKIETFRPIPLIRTRLRQKVSLKNGEPLKPKLFLDCNPPSKRHWTFLAFATREFRDGPARVRVDPTTGLPHSKPEQWAEIRMDPYHNKANLSEGYIEDQTGDFKFQRQFIEGEWYDEVENAMFSGDDIAACRLPPRLPGEHEYDRIEVAVDPAVSAHEGSDETGIVVLGRADVNGEAHAYVLEDLSGKYTPPEWGQKAVDAYHRWNANTIVAEKNQGGSMVESTLRGVDPLVPVNLIHSASGKEIRAEGSSVAYKHHRVHHCGPFTELEDQLLNFETGFKRSKRGSPDRLDALVHGLNSILLMKVRKRGAAMLMADDFWR